MLTLKLLKHFTKQYNHAFRPVQNIPEALIAGGIKVFVEYKLLSLEYLVYTCISAVPCTISDYPPLTIIPVTVATCGIIGAHTLPPYRLIKSMTDKKLMIVDL